MDLLTRLSGKLARCWLSSTLPNFLYVPAQSVPAPGMSHLQVLPRCSGNVGHDTQTHNGRPVAQKLRVLQVSTKAQPLKCVTKEPKPWSLSLATTQGTTLSLGGHQAGYDRAWP